MKSSNLAVAGSEPRRNAPSPPTADLRLARAVLVHDAGPIPPAPAASRAQRRTSLSFERAFERRVIVTRGDGLRLFRVW